MRIEYSLLARQDLQDAHEYLLAEGSVRAPEQLQRRVERLLALLAARAFEGPEDVLKSGEVVRSWPLSLWRIYYQRQPRGVLWTVRISHQAREPIPRRHRRRR